MKKFLSVTCLIVLTFCGIGTSAAQMNTTPPIAGVQGTKNQTGEPPATNGSLRGSGMSFTQNKGQIVDMDGNLRPDVLYKGDGGGTDVYLRKTGISYVYSNMDKIMDEVDEQVEALIKAGTLTEADEQKKKDELMQKGKMKIHRVDMDFAGANKNRSTINEDELDGYNNYYYGYCPYGVTNVKQYNKIIYKNIYNNIDVSYYGDKQNGIKYDLIVQPHADPNQIKLHWKGAEELKLVDGKLKIKTSVNEFYESIPRVYQNINGKIVEVKAGYKLEVKENENTKAFHNLNTPVYEITFQLSTFNSNFPLVIDPWVTYYGGTGFDAGKTVATDKSGNAIFIGGTGSVNFPVSAGAFQTSFNGSSDSYIVKFTPAGARVFATYFGGSGFGGTLMNSIATDSNTDIYVTGYASTANLPIKAWGGAFMKLAKTGPGDIFIAKFSSVGILIWSTYYGGSLTEDATGIAIDGAGNIIITGFTNSQDFPVLGAYQPLLVVGGSYDAFVIKFNNIGVLQWATFYGGNGSDQSYGIATDKANNIYVCGMTMSTNFPSIAAFQVTSGSGTNVGFLFRLDATIGFPVWSTYYGLPGTWAKSVAVDAFGDVIMVGNGGAAASIGAAQPLVTSAFLAKFSSAGLRQWGTYLGSVGSVQFINAVAIDSNNNIYVYGEFEDVDPALSGYPASTCAYQPIFGGVEDQFIAKYSASGSHLCNTNIGGTGHDESGEDSAYGGIAIYGNVLYITGGADPGYPVTVGAFQTTYGGGSSYANDAFMDQLCINLCEAKVLGLSYAANSTSVCPNAPVTFTPSVANSCDTTGYKFQWTFTGGTPATSTAVKPTVTFAGVGTHDVKLVLSTLCKKDSILKPSYITVNNCSCTMAASAAVTANTSCSGGSNGSANVTISTGSGGTYLYSWSNGSSGTTTSTTISATGLSANTYTVTVTDGACVSVSTVVITQTLSVNSITSTGISCSGGNNGSATVAISGGGGTYTYSWSNGASSITNALSSQISNLTANTYTVTITQGSCISTSTIKITEPLKMFVAISGKWSCSTNVSTSSAFPTDGTSPYTYLWSTGATTPTAAALNTGIFSVTVTDANGCTAIRSVTTTNPPPVITTLGVNISCTTQGGAIVTVVSGAGPYKYSWSNGKIDVGVQSVNTGLVAGGYTVTVTDGNGCTLIRTFNITGTSPVSADFTAPPIICTNTISTFTNTGSTGTYSWLISPINVSGTTTNFSYAFLYSGTYTIEHRVDNGGCFGIITKSITVINCGGPTVTAIGNSACPGSCVTVVSVGTGGTNPYTYSWSTGENTQNINPCPSANTTYTITISDSGGNTSTSTAVVTVNPAISAAITPTNISCNGGTNGSALATGGGGSLPYTYNWSTGATTSQISNLTSQIYAVTVSDSKGCTSVSTATVASPPALTGQFSKGTANCIVCGCKEWVMVNATGGTSPYSFAWPDGYINRYKNRLCPGTYNVNIKDKNNCIMSISITAP